MSSSDRKRWKNSYIWDLISTEGLPHLPPGHPARVTVRAGSLAVALAVVPSLVPLITSKHARKKFKISELLKREFGVNGFPFALMLVFGGGAWLEWGWNRAKATRSGDIKNDESFKRSKRRTAISTFVVSLWAIYRLRNHRKPTQPMADIPLTLSVDNLSSKTSPSLDLTIIFCVRALDALFQHAIRGRCNSEHSSSDTEREDAEKRAKVRGHLDVFLFTLASSRIMWCFVYQPFRLPQSYVKWINALAEIDNRLVLTLRALRAGTWRYGEQSPAARHILTSYAVELGYPAGWGDPAKLPPISGPSADKIWQELGVRSRSGCGGVPCELVHGDVMTPSCAVNALTRWIRAFMKAFLIYLPVHTIPTLLVNPMRFLSDPFSILTAISRSSAFLATFVGTIFSTICLSRTVLGPKLFPNLPHQTIDGPLGGVALGCITCCLSLYIERGKRRGEIALYVLPRAIRTLFKESWLRSGSLSVELVEKFAFAISCATLVTFAKYDQESLRGLSRWGLGFVLEGWESFRRKREEGEKLDRVESQASVYGPKLPDLGTYVQDSGLHNQF
ncbi:hypothetical protein FS842_000022 [Serendipita sp. 407]|nr:hypothetical protein FS842_000022 [Serendipita sp. 407]